jgi:hypothetical protein
MPKRHSIAALQATNQDQTLFPALRTGLWNGRIFDASEMAIFVSMTPWAFGMRRLDTALVSLRISLHRIQSEPCAGWGLIAGG